jgi:hypothetical protein
VEYVCGDATKLSNYFIQPEVGEQCVFDIIVDKGLSDAILCSEGFDGPLRNLMEESAKVLKRGGQYLLVSYAIPTSTQDFIRELGRKHDLEWEFDVDIGSAESSPVLSGNCSPTKMTVLKRVSFSWATKG